MCEGWDTNIVKNFWQKSNEKTNKIFTISRVKKSFLSVVHGVDPLSLVCGGYTIQYSSVATLRP